MLWPANRGELLLDTGRFVFALQLLDPCRHVEWSDRIEREMDEPQTPDRISKISADEAERRRVSVRIAIADSRIDGFPPPSRAEQEILDAFIRGDIETKDLADACKSMLSATVRATKPSTSQG
jgi:hypothetical protein